MSLFTLSQVTISVQQPDELVHLVTSHRWSQVQGQYSQQVAGVIQSQSAAFKSVHPRASAFAVAPVLAHSQHSQQEAAHRVPNPLPHGKTLTLHSMSLAPQLILHYRT